MFINMALIYISGDISDLYEVGVTGCKPAVRPHPSSLHHSYKNRHNIYKSAPYLYICIRYINQTQGRHRRSGWSDKCRTTFRSYVLCRTTFRMRPHPLNGVTGAYSIIKQHSISHTCSDYRPTSILILLTLLQ